MLHAAAGLCSVCLPDMELSVIYNTLTTTNTIIALSTPQGSYHGDRVYVAMLILQMLLLIEALSREDLTKSAVHHLI